MKTSRSPSPAREAAWRGSKAFLDEVLAGLARRPRSLPSRWFYDARGSRLFQWITNLPGYYLTRVEREILGPSTPRRAGAAPPAGPAPWWTWAPATATRPPCCCGALAGRAAVAYAPGGRLARPRWRRPAPASARSCRRAGRGRCRPAGREALGGWRARRAAGPGWCSSSAPASATWSTPRPSPSCARLRRALRPGDHLLVGFDLVKPLPLLLAAYDDPQGVTRAFNLNLIGAHEPRAGHADFDLAAFRHAPPGTRCGRPWRAGWSCCGRRRCAWRGRVVRLAAGERIRTEISCKYTGAQITAFGGSGRLRRGGPVPRTRGGWFVDALWRVDRVSRATRPGAPRRPGGGRGCSPPDPGTRRPARRPGRRRRRGS